MPVNQALEKAYNKTAKSQSRIIGISRRKEAVAKRNIIKQDKSKFSTFLYELCRDNEFSFHQEFSKAVTDTDALCISLVIDYIMNQRNQFKVPVNNDLANIADQSSQRIS